MHYTPIFTCNLSSQMPMLQRCCMPFCLSPLQTSEEAQEHCQVDHHPPIQILMQHHQSAWLCKMLLAEIQELVLSCEILTSSSLSASSCTAHFLAAEVSFMPSVHTAQEPPGTASCHKAWGLTAADHINIVSAALRACCSQQCQKSNLIAFYLNAAGGCHGTFFF
jgi:hypothetical protein